MENAHSHRKVYRFVGLPLTLVLQVSIVIFLVAALLYTMLFTTYMPVHDFFHHLRHALSHHPLSLRLLMRPKLWSLCLAAFLIAIGVADAQTQILGPEPKVEVMEGEFVCISCYTNHQATGPDHAKCGEKCAVAGMPVALRDDRDGKLYLLITEDHFINAAGPALGKIGRKVRVKAKILKNMNLDMIVPLKVELLAADGTVIPSKGKSKALLKPKVSAKGPWVCPMNDGGESEHAGKCPRCGMDLVLLGVPAAKNGLKSDACIHPALTTV